MQPFAAALRQKSRTQFHSDLPNHTMASRLSGDGPTPWVRVASADRSFPTGLGLRVRRNLAGAI
jgi:hypothetical protein